MDDAVAGEGHEVHRPGLPGLEADRRAGRDVEAKAAGLLPVEHQRRVGLEEMIVAADLHRPVAEIGDAHLESLPAGIELDLAGGRHHFAWDHAGPPEAAFISVSSFDRLRMDSLSRSDSSC